MNHHQPRPHRTSSSVVDAQRLARAAERLRLHGVLAEERGHTRLANLCWRKRVEALSELTLIAADDARAQHRHHTHRGTRMPRLY